jgi:hypothetical protein
MCRFRKMCGTPKAGQEQREGGEIHHYPYIPLHLLAIVPFYKTAFFSSAINSLYSKVSSCCSYDHPSKFSYVKQVRNTPN